MTGPRWRGRAHGITIINSTPPPPPEFTVITITHDAHDAHAQFPIMISCVRNHSREAAAAPSRSRMATSRQHPPSFFVRTYREGLSRDISEGRRYYKRRQTPDTRTRHRSKRMQTFTIQHPQANTRDFSCARKQESIHNATPSNPLERNATEASP